MPLVKPSALPAYQLVFIDAFTAIDSQLIVLHQLAFCGPMSYWTHRLAPDLVSCFSQDARMAVQVFLVLAWFLAARSLAPTGALTSEQPIWMVWQRYVRVGLPFLAALLVAIVCTDIASQWMSHGSLPESPDIWQVLVHALLMHALLDVDSLSAGAWYVAVDMQLITVLLCLLWAAKKWALSAIVVQSWVTVCMMASLFYFKRNAIWDNWALYFWRVGLRFAHLLVQLQSVKAQPLAAWLAPPPCQAHPIQPSDG